MTKKSKRDLQMNDQMKQAFSEIGGQTMGSELLSTRQGTAEHKHSLDSGIRYHEE